MSLKGDTNYMSNNIDKTTLRVDPLGLGVIVYTYLATMPAGVIMGAGAGKALADTLNAMLGELQRHGITLPMMEMFMMDGEKVMMPAHPQAASIQEKVGRLESLIVTVNDKGNMVAVDGQAVANEGEANGD